MKKCIYSIILIFFFLLCFSLNSALFLNAQTGWGSDIQVTHVFGASYSPRISAVDSTLHVVFWMAGRDSLGSYEDVFYVRSTDAGASWSDTLRLSVRNDIRSDVSPDVVADSNEIHVVWNSIGVGGNSIYYRRSTDKGQTWSAIDTGLIKRADHPRIAMAGDFLYLIAINSIDHITKFRKSINRGLTWLPEQNLGSGWQLSDIFVHQNFVHVLVQEQTPCVEIYYARSVDSGQSWSLMVMLSSNDTCVSDWPSLGGGDSLNVFAVWKDGKYSPYSWTGDIFLRYSRDKGSSWSEEDSLTVEHRASISDIQAQGDTVHVVWDDERIDPGSDNFELFYRMSTDKGITWGSEERLTNAPRPSYQPYFALSKDLLHLVWYDNRNDTTCVLSDIFYKQKKLFDVGIKQFEYVENPGYGVEILPNPFRQEIRIKYMIHDIGCGIKDFAIRIYDIIGKEVFYNVNNETKNGRICNTVKIDTKNLPCGVYFIQIKAGKIATVKKIVKIK